MKVESASKVPSDWLRFTPEKVQTDAALAVLQRAVPRQGPRPLLLSRGLHPHRLKSLDSQSPE
jgi:hypothetical protein